MLVLGPDEERVKKLQSVLADYEIEAAVLKETSEILPGKIQIIQGNLNNGFELPLQKYAIITEQDLFNKKLRNLLEGKSYRMQNGLKVIQN